MYFNLFYDITYTVIYSARMCVSHDMSIYCAIIRIHVANHIESMKNKLNGRHPDWGQESVASLIITIFAIEPHIVIELWNIRIPLDRVFIEFHVYVSTFTITDEDL